MLFLLECVCSLFQGAGLAIWGQAACGGGLQKSQAKSLGVHASTDKRLASCSAYSPQQMKASLQGGLQRVSGGLQARLVFCAEKHGLASHYCHALRCVRPMPSSGRNRAASHVMFHANVRRAARAANMIMRGRRSFFSFRPSLAPSCSHNFLLFPE